MLITLVLSEEQVKVMEAVLLKGLAKQNDTITADQIKSAWNYGVQQSYARK